MTKGLTVDGLELNNLYNMDCMEGMSLFPDKFFELAIVDPPYFNGPNRSGYYGKGYSRLNVKRGRHHIPGNAWQIPNETYFNELFRISKNQIIWGANHFAGVFESGSSCWIVWDKVNGASSYADAELAYTSFPGAVRIFRFMWDGMRQGKSINEGHIMQGNKSLNEKRIHQTQKPVLLYKWLLSKYANYGDKILDTHGGSCSSLIACMDMGFEYLGFEIDNDCYQSATKRINDFKLQTKLF